MSVRTHVLTWAPYILTIKWSWLADYQCLVDVIRVERETVAVKMIVEPCEVSKENVIETYVHLVSAQITTTIQYYARISAK